MIEQLQADEPKVKVHKNPANLNDVMERIFLSISLNLYYFRISKLCEKYWKLTVKSTKPCRKVILNLCEFEQQNFQVFVA